jgi:hypothetical protein
MLKLVEHAVTTVFERLNCISPSGTPYTIHSILGTYNFSSNLQVWQVPE